MFVALKPLAERKETADQVIARLRGKLAKEPGANLFLQPVQDIRIGGRQSNAQYQFTLQADDLAELRAWEPKIRAALSDLPELADVNTDTQDKGLQTSLVIDRDTASRLGVTPRMIDTTLNDAFGQRQVSTIYAQLNQYHVVMEAAPEYWQSPETLRPCYVSTPQRRAGAAVGVRDATARPTRRSASTTRASSSRRRSRSISRRTSRCRRRRARSRTRWRASACPNTVRGSFQGSARAFQASLASQPWLILAALLAVYIVLGVLYESYVHPITILSTLPSAGVGALLALLLFRTEFTIIAFIGVILLIGIVKKNAIMMIDFALDAERTRGLSHARRDLRGVPAALPPDHDDDDGGDAGRAAARARRRRRRGDAPAARHRDRRRPAREPDADALHDAGRLSLPRPLPPVGDAASRRGTAAPARRRTPRTD